MTSDFQPLGRMLILFGAVLIGVGVLLLIAPNERKARIEVGYGLEAVLPDGLAGEIIRDELAPAFKRGDFDGGVREGVERIIRIVRREETGASGLSRLIPANRAKIFLFLPLLVFVAAAMISLSEVAGILSLPGYAILGLCGSILQHNGLLRFFPVAFLAPFGLAGYVLGNRRGRRPPFTYNRWGSFGRTYGSGGFGGGFSGGGFGGFGGGFSGGGGASGGW